MVFKSIQYRIQCENYGNMTCNSFTDFEELKSPQAYFKKLGYRKLDDGNWYCKECLLKMKLNK